MKLELGNLRVSTGTRAEQFADRALDDIFYLSSTAPEPIRAQAEAFKEKLRVVLLHHFQAALGEK